MKNILLTTDLRAETKRAFDRAVKLALTMEAKLHILHVCPLYSFSKKKKEIISLKQDAEEMIKNSLAARKGIKRLKTSIRVVEGGETFAEIINHAERIKAGLIVMGIHGKVKLRDMFVGTTIERVIRKGIRPVLMVRDKPLNDYKNVLVGTDFSAGSKQALHVAIELSPKSTFHLVHTYDLSQVYFGEGLGGYAEYYIKNMENSIADLTDEKLESFVKENKRVLKKYNVESEKFNFRKVKGEPLACLLREATNVKSDLIAIGSHGQPSLMPYKIGGTARDILTTPPCDVLIAKGL